MNPARVSVRFPAVDVPGDLTPAIATFHRFIQRGAVEGAVLDVADYRHVPDGPGVLLVGHDVDYGIDAGGLRIVRKRQADDVATQLADCLRMGLGLLAAVERDGGLQVTVDTGRASVQVLDRRATGPDGIDQASFTATVRSALVALFGHDTEVVATSDTDPRAPLTVDVRFPAAEAADLLATLGGSRAPGQSPWDITVQRFAELRERDDVVVLDVREENEYAIANIGGRLVPLAQLAEHIDELAPDARTVVHCRAGTRGAQAVAQLRDAGFDDVWNLNGGLMAWIDEVDPSLTRY